MPEYTITARERPSWQFTAEDFAEAIRKRWPNARVGIRDLPRSPMIVHALVPFEPPRRELGIALSSLGNAVILDPADPDTAAEFVLWYVTQLPEFDPPVYLFTDDMRSVELRPDVTADEIVRTLTG